MASHDVGQIERDGRLSPGKDELEETEGLHGWSTNPTCCEPDQEHISDVRSGSFVPHAQETVNNRISHSSKEGSQELSVTGEM